MAITAQQERELLNAMQDLLDTRLISRVSHRQEKPMDMMIMMSTMITMSMMMSTMTTMKNIRMTSIQTKSMQKMIMQMKNIQMMRTS